MIVGSGLLAQLLTTVTDPTHIVTMTDFAALKTLGVRSTGMNMRYDVLGEYAELAAQGRFTIPVAATYPLKRLGVPEDVGEAIAGLGDGRGR